jgi:predicted ATPase/DNA-binding CsgD family transcriptional regulator
VATVGLDLVSAREAEVLAAVRDRRTNAEIARQLHISVRTVESHVSSLLRKLGASDRQELARQAARLLPETPVPGGELLGVPATWTTFVGRENELQELSKALADGRLVTLLGPGGVGKTRLAVALLAGATGPLEGGKLEAGKFEGGKFEGGGAFVDLVPVSPEFVLEAVASALGVTGRPQQPLQEAVHQRLRTGRTLLVLDNCEHVLASVATFCASVLASCPEAVVLATSRERLGVIGERVLLLGPLSLGGSSSGSDAEQLFVERSSAAMTGEVSAVDAALIAEICRRLDGMPLAIELAAARSGSLGLDGLLSGLDDHLRLLSGSGAPGERHRSMRIVIDWSHQLLDEDERVLFRRLGLFAGPFDLRSAAAVAGDGRVAATSDVIGRLADKSLLVHQRADDGSRWRMLDSVAAYARERLGDSGERPEIQRNHLRWASETAGEIERSLEGAEPWRERFDATADDLRAALRGIDPAPGGSSGFDLARSLGHLSYARGFLVEARDHFETAEQRAPDEPAALEALHMAAGSALAEMRGQVAYDLLRRGSDRAGRSGDRKGAAISLAQAAALAGRFPALFVEPLDHGQLVDLIEQARAMASPQDLDLEAQIAVATAWAERGFGPRPQLARAEEALVLARELGDPVLISSALDAGSEAAAAGGRFKQASRLTTERIALLDRLPSHDPRVGGEVVDIYHMATESALAAGELPVALSRARSSRHDRSGHGMPHFGAAHLVVPLVLQGAFDEALGQAEIMLEGWESAGRPVAGWMAPSFFAAALVHGLRGEEDAHARWWAMATAVRMRSRVDSFAVFAEARLALHLGRIGGHRSSPVEPPGDHQGRQWARAYGCYHPYAQATMAELAVVARVRDARAWLDSTRVLAAENDFATASLRRAAGRLRGDDAELEASVSAWEAIGARFERACTLLLLPSRADEGVAELAALRCPLPRRFDQGRPSALEALGPLAAALNDTG